MRSSPLPPYTQIVRAFPGALAGDAAAAAACIPAGGEVSAQGEIGALCAAGEPVHIPARVYFAEPHALALAGLSDTQAGILHCVYTRHHNGFVREKHVRWLFDMPQAWVPPFVLQLLGEYVLEIIALVAENVAVLPPEPYQKFIRENPVYIDLLKQRIVSYWNCYYRVQYPHFRAYAGFQAAERLGLWNQRELRRLGRGAPFSG